MYLLGPHPQASRRRTPRPPSLWASRSRATPRGLRVGGSRGAVPRGPPPPPPPTPGIEALCPEAPTPPTPRPRGAVPRDPLTLRPRGAVP
ncbi:hypothetical protein KY289_036841 [Solanum tuberosum]|nr:hypothetical protein KY289_036841 [Solanum tuberosum]